MKTVDDAFFEYTTIINYTGEYLVVYLVMFSVSHVRFDLKHDI